jgi:hypothetical protein
MRRIAFPFFALLLLGSVTVAQAAANKASVFNELPPKEGYVRLYLYRVKQFVGSGIKPLVKIDGVEIGKLANGGCLALYIRPGSHSLETKLSIVNYPLKGDTASFETPEKGEFYLLYAANISSSEKPGYIVYRNGFVLPDVEFSKVTIKASTPIPLDPDVLEKKAR